MPIRTEGFDHVHLHVQDVESALAFSRRAFDAKELFRVGHELAFVRLSGGEVVGLDARPEPSPVHVGLRLTDGDALDAAIDEIVGAGGSLLERGEHEPGRPYAYVADPDGNVLEL